MRWLLAAAVATLALALAAPTVAAPKKPKPPPPPPPDTAADCTFTAQADVPDYLVLATLILRVDCATVKQGITVTATEFTRDGASFPDPVQHGHVLEHDDVHLGSTSSRTTTIRSRPPETSATAPAASGSSEDARSDRPAPARTTRASDGMRRRGPVGSRPAHGSQSTMPSGASRCVATPNSVARSTVRSHS